MVIVADLVLGSDLDVSHSAVSGCRETKRPTPLFLTSILADAAIYLRSHDEGWMEVVTLPC